MIYIYCIIYIIITCISWGCVQHSTAVQPSMALYALYIYTKVWRATSGRRMSRRAADGRTPRRAADRRALDRRALHYDGHAPVTVVRVGPPGHFVLKCLLSSPPPPVLHSHKPVIAGNGRGTGNGHSPLHSIVHSSINSMRVRLSDVPLRGPPWPAARRVLPCMHCCVKHA